MANTEKPEVTQAEIDHARQLWVNFTGFIKWNIIGIIIALGLMALFLL